MDSSFGWKGEVGAGLVPAQDARRRVTKKKTKKKRS